MVSVTDVFWPPASTTVTPNEVVPGTVGVPVIVPDASMNDRPAGMAPPPNVHTNGPVPPDAERGSTYGTPISPSGRAALIPWATEIDITFDADCPLRSMTVTVKLAVVACVGVPAMTPVVGLRFRPLGRTPAVTDHVNGPMPLAAESTVT